LVSDIKGVTQRVFGPKRDEVTGEWRKLHVVKNHPDITCTDWVVTLYVET
jgi:hypothetical protein